jgi:hypothetical protein
VVLSGKIHIGITNGKIDREKVEELLSRLVNILLALMQEIREKPALKKLKAFLQDNTGIILEEQAIAGKDFESIEEEEPVSLMDR